MVDPILVITEAADPGTGYAEGLAAALEVLRDRVSVEVCETAGAGDLDGILHRAGSRRIVTAGNDASLHTVIATLHRRNDLLGKVLGLVPLGSGHEVALAAGLPLDPAEAAGVLIEGVPRPMDLIVDELGEIVVQSVRLTAADGSEPAPGRTDLVALVTAPLRAALARLDPPSARLRIELDGVVVADVDQRLTGIALGHGAGAGTLEIILTPAPDPRDRLALVLPPLRRPVAVPLAGTRVTVAGEDFWIRADNEVSGPERRRTWHVEPGVFGLIAR
ncbi:MAG: diacylglycerol kinase, catalytic region [Marmoricola sp.]|nr:diacylglycerol kinase, catalytic region [Marmoricola sp.]